MKKQMKVAEKEIRVVELVARRETLKQVEEGLETEMEKTAMTMFARALDENFDAKMITTKTLLTRWIKEIEHELNELSQEVFEENISQEVERKIGKSKERTEANTND